MSIMSKTTGLTVYKAANPGVVTADVLKRFAFKPIDGTTDARAFGFVNIDDYLDTEWAKSPPEKGEFTAFSLRVDERRIPGAVFKKHFQVALEKELAALKEHGKKFLGRDRKQELRVQARLRLLAKAEPIPAVFDIVIDGNGRIFFTGTTRKAKLLFEHMAVIMGLIVEEQTPAILSGEKRDPTVNPELGCGFLSWILLGMADFSDGDVRIADMVRVAGDRNVITASFDEGAVDEIAEIKDKKATKARVSLAYGGETYHLTVNGNDLSITGLKTPKIDKKRDDEDPDGRFLEKMYLISAAVDGLYEAYREWPGSVIRQAA
jgi:hypothetical protein